MADHGGIHSEQQEDQLKRKVFWFQLPPATKAPRSRPSPRRRAEENEKKQAETGGSG